MPQNRGNAISFGKIVLSSEVESMDSLVKHLGNVIRDHGYPSENGPVREKDEKTDADVRDAEQKLRELMSPNGNANPEL